MVLHIKEHDGYQPKAGHGYEPPPPPHGGSSVQKPNAEIRFLGDLQRLDVKPGDKFVLTIDRPVTATMASWLQDMWKKFMGGDDAAMLLILESGMKLGVIRPEKSEG